MGFYFPTAAVSRRIRDLYLVAREVERFGISLGEELAFHCAALYGFDRVRLYRVAPLHRALADARDFDICNRRAGYGESAVPDVFSDWRACVLVSSWRGYLEFSLQVGTCGDGSSTAGCRATRCACRSRV